MSNLNDTKNNIENVKEDTKNMTGKLKDNALEAVQVIKQKVITAGEEALDKSSELKNGAVVWVQSNPIKTAGLAFVLGVAFF